MTENEMTEMRDIMLGVIDFAPTDAELAAAWANPRLVGLTHEELAAELERIHRDPNRSTLSRPAAVVAGSIRGRTEDWLDRLQDTEPFGRPDPETHARILNRLRSANAQIVVLLCALAVLTAMVFAMVVF